MGTIRKLLLRRPVVTALLILLLALGVAFASIGLSALGSAVQQARAVKQSYTTIALPLPNQTEQFYMDHIDPETNLISFDEAEYEAFREAQDQCQAAAEGSKHVEAVENRTLLCGYVPGSVSLTSRSTAVENYNWMQDYGYDFSVFAVRCLSSELRESGYSIAEDGTVVPVMQCSATFSVLEAPAVHSSYRVPEPDEKLDGVNVPYLLPDGSAPFEEGKDYLIYGMYCDYPIGDGVVEEKDENGVTRFAWGRVPDTSQPLRFYIGAIWLPSMFESVEASNGTYTYAYIPEGAVPAYAELTGSVEDFLASEEGTVWREEILPTCERTYQSVHLLLTKRIDSLYAFNSGTMWISQGRSYTVEEALAEAPVCLVSQAYAEANGLSVGDQLEMDLYNGSFHSGSDMMGSSTFYLKRYPCASSMALDRHVSYTIVGIYAGPEFSDNLHSINANTVIAPAASVPEGESYTIGEIPLLYALVVKTGEAEAMEAELEALGFGGKYLYYDQGYGEAREAVDSLMASSVRLLVLSACVFVLAACVCFFLLFRRVRPSVRAERLMGRKPRRVLRSMLPPLLGLLAVSVLLGMGLGAALYERVCGLFLANALTLQIPLLLASGGVLFLLLAAVLALLAQGSVRRALMGSGSRAAE